MDPEVFNIFDLVALVVLLASAFVGYRRKLSGEIANLISIVAVFIVGYFAYEPVNSWLAGKGDMDERTMYVATYIVTILVSLGIMVVVRLVVGGLISIVIEEQADKMAGLFAGIVRGVLIILIVFLIMNLVPHENLNNKFGEESFVGRIVLKILPAVDEKIESIKEEMQE